jgi:hypothetical protein
VNSRKKREGLTEIIDIGALYGTTLDPKMLCSVTPTTGSTALVRGETMEYRYYY